MTSEEVDIAAKISMFIGRDDIGVEAEMQIQDNFSTRKSCIVTNTKVLCAGLLVS
jgi:hypothetical protein